MSAHPLALLAIQSMHQYQSYLTKCTQYWFDFWLDSIASKPSIFDMGTMPIIEITLSLRFIDDESSAPQVTEKVIDGQVLSREHY